MPTRYVSKLLKIAFVAFTAIAIGSDIVIWRQQGVYRFEGWRGPEAPTVVAPARSAVPADFETGNPSRLAILVTDAQSSWLGIVRALATIGVPFIVTQDWRTALKHRVVWVYPTISGRVLDVDALHAIGAHPGGGGTIIASEILGGGLQALFGFNEAAPSFSRKTFRWTAEGAQTFGFSGSEEATLAIGDSNKPVGSYAYRGTSADVVATYEDGDAAMVSHRIGDGYAIALGIDLGAFFAGGYDQRQYLARSYVNSYEPTIDTFLRAIKQIYRRSEPNAVVLNTVPSGHAVSIVMTHDVDFTRSIVNALQYAEYERSQGIAGTYFIQTKYVRDWNDDVFFNRRGAEITSSLAALGSEIASHSVAHSQTFSKFAMGDGAERYPDYEPVVKARLDTRGATILGELRVSRYLLEHSVSGLKVNSFRPGHLQNPFALPQALEAAGYLYSSSVTSGSALTHLPFRTSFDRANKALTSVFEFPITIEDEKARPMDSRVDAAIEIVRHLAQYGGSCTVLIHPDVLDDKLAFERRFIDETKKLDAWYGTVREFGEWWAARDAVRVDVSETSRGPRVELNLSQPIAGLALDVPKNWRWIATDPASVGSVASPGRIVVTAARAGTVTLVFQRM